MNPEIKIKLIEFSNKIWDDANDKTPDFIIDADPEFLIIDPVTFNLKIIIPIKITIPDIIKFYKSIQPYLNDKNIEHLTEYLTLGSVQGFYKEIGFLAKICFLWFKFINWDELQTEANKLGLKNISTIHSKIPKQQQVLF